MKQRTIITATGPTGKVVFRAVEPRIMSKEEIRRECKKWSVPHNSIIVKFE